MDSKKLVSVYSLLGRPVVNSVRSASVVTVPNSICVSGATVGGWYAKVIIGISWCKSTRAFVWAVLLVCCSISYSFRVRLR